MILRYSELFENKIPAGFDTDEVLYHGTDSTFDVFDKSFNKTAKHFYTTPDIEVAKGYGKNVYALYGKQSPQANLTDRDSVEYWELLKELYNDLDIEKDYDWTLEEFEYKVSDGRLYDINFGRLQNDIMDELFSKGFRSVRFIDAGFDGHFANSIVFDDPSNMHIISDIIS